MIAGLLPCNIPCPRSYISHSFHCNVADVWCRLSLNGGDGWWLSATLLTLWRTVADDVSDIQSDPDPDDFLYGGGQAPSSALDQRNAGGAGAAVRQRGPPGAGMFSEEGVGIDRLDAWGRELCSSCICTHCSPDGEMGMALLQSLYICCDIWRNFTNFENLVLVGFVKLDVIKNLQLHTIRTLESSFNSSRQLAQLMIRLSKNTLPLIWSSTGQGNRNLGCKNCRIGECRIILGRIWRLKLFLHMIHLHQQQLCTHLQWLQFPVAVAVAVPFFR